MRIRPINIAGMSMAVWVTAVLVFVAGLPVPAQAEDYYIYVKNSRSKNYNFCTHETGHVPLSQSPLIEEVRIRSTKCEPLKCGESSDSTCLLKRCRYGDKIHTSTVGDHLRLGNVRDVEEYNNLIQLKADDFDEMLDLFEIDGGKVTLDARI